MLREEKKEIRKTFTKPQSIKQNDMRAQKWIKRKGTSGPERKRERERDGINTVKYKRRDNKQIVQTQD